jgi:regulatory protein
MSTVTAVSPIPRHPGRYELGVDGKSFAVLSLDAIERLHLAVGTSVAGLEEQIAHEAAALKVYDRALNMLAFRARASRELARALSERASQRNWWSAPWFG